MKSKQLNFILVIILLVILIVLVFNYKKETFSNSLPLNRLLRAGPTGEDGENGESSFNILRDEIAKDDTNVDQDLALALRAGLGVGIVTDDNPNDSQIINRFTNFLRREVQRTLSENVEGEVERQIRQKAYENSIERLEEQVNKLNNFGGIPDYTVIPFHINAPDGEVNTDSAGRGAHCFIEYLDTKDHVLENGRTADSSIDQPGRVIVGGVNDTLDMLPFGFQVCNGAKLQKIVTDDGAVGVEPDDSGLDTPDYRGRVPLGGGRSSGNRSNLQTQKEFGGERAYDDNFMPFYYQSYTGGSFSHTLETSEMPSHNHGVTDNEHAHYQGTRGDICSGDSCPLSGAGWEVGGQFRYGLNVGESTSTTGISIQSRGGGGPHNNMMPYKPTLFLIKIRDARS
tara:strand:- start:275 stop:1468 length:1194 start_codon:yes stop_codon:yes gene_type:complete